MDSSYKIYEVDTRSLQKNFIHQFEMNNGSTLNLTKDGNDFILMSSKDDCELFILNLENLESKKLACPPYAKDISQIFYSENQILIAEGNEVLKIFDFETDNWSVINVVNPHPNSQIFVFWDKIK